MKWLCNSGAPPATASLAGCLTRLLPRGVAVAEICDSRRVDVPRDHAAPPCAPSERRERDFARGRACARRALEDLGVRATSIPRGPRGEPQWPAGIVGTITHTDDYVAAVAAPRSLLRGIGIDAERQEGMTDDVLDVIATPGERDWIRAAGPAMPWALLLFSAKESVFKACFGVVGWIDFQEARVHLDARRERFRAVVQVGESTTRCVVHGRFHVSAAHVLTAAVLPR
jgi:4'-phosphopantetheinyl transferase EntD